VGTEDDLDLPVPGEYHADTSRLFQMLTKGHSNVRLDAEAWARLVTWADLNAPCHGTWGEVYPVPNNAHKRRMALRKQYGGPDEDPEVIPDLPEKKAVEPIVPAPAPKQTAAPPAVPGWPFDAGEAKHRQAAAGPCERTIELGSGVTMKLVRIPAGEFVMGDAAGEFDERPMTHAVIKQPFWLGACEVTNEQYHQFDPTHDSGYARRFRVPGTERRTRPLNQPQQPAVRVSWEQATAFCRWLSERTGMTFALPTEAQWEYACRAGASTPFSYGALGMDYSKFGNMAGKELWRLGDRRFKDGAIVALDVGRYQPNAWGLHDMHGNVAEWTRSTYRPDPYRDDDGRNAPDRTALKVVRGGSFYEKPNWCRSAFRWRYPAWRRVYNVGFRVAVEDK
jgi:formylglycine-generating enzyme required for sulfatase activity